LKKEKKEKNKKDKKKTGEMSSLTDAKKVALQNLLMHLCDAARLPPPQAMGAKGRTKQVICDEIFEVISYIKGKINNFYILQEDMHAKNERIVITQ